MCYKLGITQLSATRVFLNTLAQPVSHILNYSLDAKTLCCVGIFVPTICACRPLHQDTLRKWQTTSNIVFILHTYVSTSTQYHHKDNKTRLLYIHTHTIIPFMIAKTHQKNSFVASVCASHEFSNRPRSNLVVYSAHIPTTPNITAHVVHTLPTY